MALINPDQAGGRNANANQKKYWRITFWVWAGAIYISLIYSTGLCQSYGFERTITHAYFLSEGEGNYGPGSNYGKYYKDVGALVGTHFSELRTQELWKLATFSGDAGYYLLQSVSLGLSVPPYKFRFLATTVVGLIAWLIDTQALIPLIFVLVNVTAIFSTAILLTYSLIKDFGFTSHVALVGGVLFVTLVACTTTVSQPMVDPMSLFFSMLICLAVIRQNVILFMGASILGVASKEILLFASLLWFVNSYPVKGTGFRELLKTFCISVVPIVAFVVIRFMLGGRPDQVSYGFNLLESEFPELLHHVFRKIYSCIDGHEDICRLRLLVVWIVQHAAPSILAALCRCGGGCFASRDFPVRAEGTPAGHFVPYYHSFVSLLLERFRTQERLAPEWSRRLTA